MDILSFIIARELDEMGFTAGQFNELPDREKMNVYNSLRFSVKAKLRHHNDLLSILDKEIGRRLFEGCDP